MMGRSVILFLVVLFSVRAFADPSDTAKSMCRIRLDAYAQFAGGQGLWSCGILATRNERIGVSIGFGHTPPAYGNIFTLTGKCVYTPWNIRLNDAFTLYPLGVGLYSSLSSSDKIKWAWDKTKYPNNYYWWPASLRTGPIVQFALQGRFGSYLITPYFEVSTNDLYLASYFGNARSLSLPDILVMGAGVRFRLKPSRPGSH